LAFKHSNTCASNFVTKTQKVLQSLRDYESRNVTHIEADGTWPIVWARAKGVHVWDAQGRKYLDLTAAFGVAAAGHANASVVKAGQKQMAKLLHAMGDVHPHELKAQLARELSRITFERWSKNQQGKTIFGNSGFEAVEAALKTALLATGKGGVIAFQGAYHGLGYGALNATHRDHFRSPFRMQLSGFAEFVPFPGADNQLAKIEKQVRALLSKRKIGAILVEPIQARGGINVPPPEFFPLLRKLCHQHGALLILDEIYTGFGRTGKWFACEHSKTVPDLICLGKALTGGFPLSACVGSRDIMDAAWPVSRGEAIHTSTYLGHPVGCAMALAQIKEIEKLGLPEVADDIGSFLLRECNDRFHSMPNLDVRIRGAGLMVGIDLRTAGGAPATELSLHAIKSMLQRGFILLPEGEHANVIGLTPPLTISKRELAKAVAVLKTIIVSSP
jgi:4-aminobutyrate aminotransferase-like enzyme